MRRQGSQCVSRYLGWAVGYSHRKLRYVYHWQYVDGWLRWWEEGQRKHSRKSVLRIQHDHMMLEFQRTCIIPSKPSSTSAFTMSPSAFSWWDLRYTSPTAIWRGHCELFFLPCPHTFRLCSYQDKIPMARCPPSSPTHHQQWNYELTYDL